MSSEPSESLLTADAKHQIRKYMVNLITLPGVAVTVLASLIGFFINDVVRGSAYSNAYAIAFADISRLASQAAVASDVAKRSQQEATALRDQLDTLVQRAKDATEATAAQLAVDPTFKEDVLDAVAEKQKDRISGLSLAVRDLSESVSEQHRSLTTLTSQRDATSTWPHAISCGSPDYDRLFVLQAKPLTAEGKAWYVQSYGGVDRYVRFNSDLTYHDYGGDQKLAPGCEGKSIDQLRKENRTFELVQK